MVFLSAGLSIALAAVIGAAGYVGPWVVAGAGGVCVLALALGWPSLLLLPHRLGTSALIIVVGGGSMVTAIQAGPTANDPSRPLSAFAAVIAVALLLAFLHELVRRDGRVDVVESLTGTLTGQVIAVLAAGWVLLAQIPGGTQDIVLAAAAVVASRIVLALPAPPMTAIWISIVAAGAAGVAAALALNTSSPLKGLVAGACIGGAGVAIDRLLDAETAMEEHASPHSSPTTLSRWAVLARAAAPVAAAGAVAYALLQFSPG